MTDTLAAIVARTRADLPARKAAVPETALREAAARVDGPRGFARALLARRAAGAWGLIAEVKRASPSRGVIRADFDPAAHARAYAAGGATCLSVLTEPHWFGGALSDLTAARAACPLPVLRKDFIVDPYQLAEARAAGADCVLLIMAALSDEDAAALEAEAVALGLDVLVEVHDADEIARALRLNTPLIGINNRNLKTLAVDLGTTAALAPLVPPERLIVCESGIAGAADLARVKATAGVTTFLVGETLMRAHDVAAATTTLLA